MVSRETSTKLLAALLAGSILTIALFVAQLLFFTSDWSSSSAYLHGQMGAEDKTGKGRMLVTIALRTALSVAPALFAGAVAGIVVLIRKQKVNWLQASALLYPLVFAGMALLLTRFYYRELSMYQHLAFPLTVLATTAMQEINRKTFAVALLALAVASAGYPLARSTIPSLSLTSRAFATQFQALARPQDVVVTNMDDQQPPFQAWDVAGIEKAASIADRLFRLNVVTKPRLDGLLDEFKTRDLSVVYLLSPGIPVEEPLKSFLSAQPNHQTLHFEPPVEPPSLLLSLRSFYWKLSGKHLVKGPPGKITPVDIDVYHFTLRRP